RDGMLRMAAWLDREGGVRPGDRVAISLPKSLEAVVTIYGVLAAGAAFVPLPFRGAASRLYAALDSVPPLLLPTTAHLPALRTPRRGGRRRLWRGCAGARPRPWAGGRRPRTHCPRAGTGQPRRHLLPPGPAGAAKGRIVGPPPLRQRDRPLLRWGGVGAREPP